MKRSRVETVTIKRRRATMESFGPMPAGESRVRILHFGANPEDWQDAIREWQGDPRATSRNAQRRRKDDLDGEIAACFADSRRSAKALGALHCQNGKQEIVWRAVGRAVSASRIEKAVNKARKL